MNLKKQFNQSSGSTKTYERILVPLGIFFLSAFYLLYFCKYNFKIADEGIPLNGALRMLRGEIPWVDFYGYAPGRYMFYSRLFDWFGEDLMVPRRAIALLTAGATTLIFLSCRYVMSIPFSLTAAVLFLAAPGVYYGRYTAIFFSIAAYFAVCHLKKNKFAAFFLGFVAGVAYLFRTDLGYIFLFLSFLLFAIKNFWHENDRHGAIKSSIFCFLGASCTLAPLFIAIIRSGLLAKMIDIQNRFFFGGYQTLVLPFPKWSLNSPDEFLLFYIPVLIYFGATFYLIKEIKVRRLAAPDFFIFFLLLGGVGIFNQALWRTQPENILKIIVPAIMLGCFFSQLLIVRQSSMAIRGFFSGVILIFVFSYVKVMNTKYAFFLGSAGFSTHGFRLMDADRGKVYAREEHVDVYSKMISYLQKNTEEEETVFIVPFMGHPLYFLANRRNPSFYEWVLPPEAAIIPNLEEEIINDLEEANTPLIVHYDFALDNKEERRFKNYTPKLHKYIFENYYLDEIIENYWMLRRGESNISAIQQQTNDSTEKIKKTLSWGQTFKSQKNDLSQIRVRIATRALEIKGALILHLALEESPEFDIRMSSRNFGNTVLEEWLAFEFTPVPDSKGKKYYFYLTVPDDSDVNPVALGIFRGDNYTDGNLMVNGKPKTGDLSFVALS